MKLAICSVLKTDHAVSGPAGKSWDTDAGCQVGASEESNQVKEFFRYIPTTDTISLSQHVCRVKRNRFGSVFEILSLKVEFTNYLWYIFFF